MLTGELRSQINSVWNAFWSGGISNPLESELIPTGDTIKYGVVQPNT